MSKKKPGKREKKPLVRKVAKKKAAPKPKPKAQKLPGMDQPKVRSLDAVCEKLADVRETLNDARTKEKELVGQALFHLKNHNIAGYKAHGIELYRVQGDEKVRVRVVDDDSTGDDGSEEYMGGMMDEGAAHGIGEPFNPPEPPANPS